MSNLGLSVSDVVNVQVVMSPIAAATRNFGSLLVLGDSGIIDTTERIRLYTTLTGVASDFGLSAPEYQAAALYFDQSPQPTTLYIGRWAGTATPGILHGAILTPAQQALSNFTSIASGGFNIAIDGVTKNLTGLNFSSAANLNAVAAIIQTALAGATCVWNSTIGRFDITSPTTGAGTAASGTITFNSLPANNDTVTLGGTAVTFVTGTPSGNQVQIGATPGQTAAAFQAFLSASNDANITKCVYTTNGNVTTATYASVGTVGNAFTLAKSSTSIVVSGATLSGGINASSVGYATSPATGADISSLLGLTSGLALTPVAASNAETLLSAVNTLASLSNDWYGLYVASSVAPQTADYLAVAGYIEGASPSRIFGITTQDTSTLISTVTTDLASQLHALGYNRTFIQYSGNNAYAAASIFGRAFTVDFTGSNTTLTIKFKQEPGVAPELLTETQAATLNAKDCNVFVAYNNATNIIQQGVMSGGYFFDEVHGTDWLQNYVQTAIWNLLYTSTTKIPQTDAGINQIVATVSQALEQARVNGLIAPGVWQAAGFGAISMGDTLSKGYYVYAAPVSSQSAADRQARKSPVIQCAIKLAGAVHFANCIINVNR